MKQFFKILQTHLKKNYAAKKHAANPWCKEDVRYFAKGVIRLNELFTFNRENRHYNYFDDPVLRSGYLAYFLPLNALKSYFLFKKYDLFKKLPSKITVSDLGCGPFTLSFGFIFYLLEKLKKQKSTLVLEINAVEQNKKIIADGQILLREFLKEIKASDLGLTVRVCLQKSDLKKRVQKKCLSDVVLVGNFLNEIASRQDQHDVVKKIKNLYLKKNGYWFIIEPANKKSSRDLQAMRDHLIHEYGFNVHGPCLHSNKCPLNHVNKNDWCHQRSDWHIPDWVNSFDKAAKLKKHYLLYSCLLLSHNKINDHKNSEFVAITDVMKVGKHFELVGCGLAGLCRFVQHSQYLKPGALVFNNVGRGQVFEESKNMNKIKLF